MTRRKDLVPPDHVIVVFGATGDLARRKLFPALYHLDQEGLMPARYCVIGSSTTQIHDDEFRAGARDAVGEFGRCSPGDDWPEFESKLSFVPGAFGPDGASDIRAAVERAEKELGGEPCRLFYLAVPPAAFSPITQGLAASGLTERARVVFEKPFGRDSDSFRELNDVVSEALAEDQVYRIDHFLGKETVQNILALRFANGIFEPMWHRNYLDHVQIDVAEDLGVGTRGKFYESVGALRDMLVSHLLQVLSFVAIEPPPHFDPKALTDEVAKVFESISPLECDQTVYGQYEGYRDEAGVVADSRTETFVAARMLIDNWRWTGVPFYLRTGKRMAEQRSAVTLAFKHPPRAMFRQIDRDNFNRDHLTMELGPNEGVTVTFMAKAPGPEIVLDDARMEFRYESSFGSELIEAYERLVHDAMIGDRTLFTRADGIERTWELVAPVLENPPEVHSYPKGSWGPAAAEDLIAPRRWHLPD